MLSQCCLNVNVVQILPNVVLILPGQHYTGKNSMQCCSEGSRQYNGQEKFLFNVALILLGQQFTGENLIQCCPRGSRQHFIRKNIVV